MKFNLGWGNAVAVRQAFVDNCHGAPTFFDNNSLLEMDYPSHNGNEELLKITAGVIKRQIGRGYKHIFLTNGATGAVTIALRAYSFRMNSCLTSRAPYFSLYPAMISAAGLKHCNTMDEVEWDEEPVLLVDSPSNPTGKQAKSLHLLDLPLSNVIWDACYANSVYVSERILIPPHSVVCGSYSKLTGLNAVRIGWIATNCDVLAERIGHLVTGEYCGLSGSSTRLLLNLLDGFDWESFERNGKFRLDLNRSEWQKVTRFFGGEEVPINGMFYYSPIDESAKKLMAKAGVEFMSGAKMGTDDGFARFNLGQGNETVSDAVKSILRADKIK